MQELGTQASAISELKKSTDATKATSQNLTALQEQARTDFSHQFESMWLYTFVYQKVTGTRLPPTLNPAKKPASVMGHLRAPTPPHSPTERQADTGAVLLFDRVAEYPIMCTGTYIEYMSVSVAF